MTCETVLNELLVRPLTELDDLRPHLDTCPRCAAALRALTAGEAAIAHRLDTFAQGGDLPRALDAALAPPTPPLRSWLLMFAVAAAVVAVLALPPFVRWQSAAPAPESPSPEAAAPAAPPGPQTRSVGEAPAPEPALEPAAPAPEPLRSSIAPEPPCEVDLSALEAREGELDAPTRACLEQLAAGADDRRAVASRLLVHDAFARRDLDAWTRLAERHLTSVDPDDGHTAYLTALMATQLPGHEAAGIRLAGHGLRIYLREPAGRQERKLARDRALTMHKLRVQASQSLWNQAVAAGDPAAESLRAQTLAFATEWHAYALQNGEPTRLAEKVCESAGGTCGR